MNNGDLYVTPNGQHRLIIGRTSDGDIAFATRGKDPTPDYNHCQIQSSETFAAEGAFEKAVAPTELTRVQQMFANYIAKRGIK